MVAVMLESFYSARQQFQEEEARGAALQLKQELQETATRLDAGNKNSAKTDCELNFHPLDPLLEDLAKSCDSSSGLRRKLEGFFAW